MTFRTVVMYGSVRHHRQGIKGARFVVNQLEQRDHQVTFLDPMEDELPLLDKMYKEYEPGEAPELMEQIARSLNEADGFVIVSGEYNHGVPPALKNLLDHF